MTPIVGNSGTYEAFLSDYYHPLRLRCRETDGWRLHKVTSRNLSKFLGRQAMLTDLNDMSITRFMAWMLNKGDSPVTVNDNRNRLLAAWRLAFQLRLVETLPTIGPEIEPTRVPLAWMREEIIRLFSCRREEGTICGIKASVWWWGLHLLMWDTGERIGAVLSIGWSDLDIETNWLIIPAEVRKRKTEDKAFRLHAETVKVLASMRSPQRTLIFPWDKSRGTLYNHYVKILKRADLTHDRKSKFHRVRKSVASYAEAAGMNATLLLGHSSRKVTKSYLDPRIVVGQQASDVLFRPDKKY